MHNELTAINFAQTKKLKSEIEMKIVLFTAALALVTSGPAMAERQLQVGDRGAVIVRESPAGLEPVFVMNSAIDGANTQVYVTFAAAEAAGAAIAETADFEVSVRVLGLVNLGDASEPIGYVAVVR